MGNILQIRDLVINFGGIKAVQNVSLDVPEGSIVTLIGANGAGKSTTLRAVAGVIRPTSGEILYTHPTLVKEPKTGVTEEVYQTENIVGLSPDKIVSKGITMVPEGRQVFPNLTVLENLKIGAYLRSDDLTDDINHVYDLFPRLKERSWQMAGTLSGGEQQMLAVGRALMAKPRLIMMDEPSLGLAPLVVQGIFDIIREINKAGISVLVNEQNANMALRMADLGYVYETGRITMTGAGRDLLADERIKEAYLGKSK